MITISWCTSVFNGRLCARKIRLIWFNKEYLNVKLTENSIIYKINYLTDTEKALWIENLKEYINIVSF